MLFLTVNTDCDSKNPMSLIHFPFILDVQMPPFRRPDCLVVVANANTGSHTEVSAELQNRGTL